MKLELKHLAPYLPYGLKWIGQEGDAIYTMVGHKGRPLLKTEQGFDIYCSDDFKPLLLPLSSLTKEIEHNGERFVPIDRLNEMCVRNGVIRDGDRAYSVEHFSKKPVYLLHESWNYNVKMWPYVDVQNLIEWHFDLYDLIDRGLAIDINTLSPLLAAKPESGNPSGSY